MATAFGRRVYWVVCDPWNTMVCSQFRWYLDTNKTLMYHGHYSSGEIELSCVFFGDLLGCLSQEVGGLWVRSSSHSVAKLYG